MRLRSGSLWAIGLALVAPELHAQDLDLGGKPGSAPVPIQITAAQGITWRQADQVVIASGQAQAVRGAVTVQADQLIAHYRKKAGAASATPASANSTSANSAARDTPPATAATNPQDEMNNGGTELYQLDAVGHVHIFTASDNAYGDHATYNMDKAVLVLTGSHVKLTTLHDVVTARDSIEYYSAKHQAVARGNALIVADDGRTIAADTLIGYLAAMPGTAAVPVAKPAGQDDPLAQAGQLRKVDAIGHVVIHTSTDTATGNSGVYLPPSGLARLGGNVHISRGGNRLAGSDALVNMKTGIATLLAAPGGRVSGTIIPGSAPTK